MVTRFAEELVEGYGENADTTWILDNFKVAVVPIVNPDGRNFAEEGYLWRKNTNPNPPPEEEPAPFPDYGIDLNRNFSEKWGEIEGGSSNDPSEFDYRGVAPFSEPETQAVRDYVTSLFPDQKAPGDFESAPDDTTGVFLDVHSFGTWLSILSAGQNCQQAIKKDWKLWGASLVISLGQMEKHITLLNG